MKVATPSALAFLAAMITDPRCPRVILRGLGQHHERVLHYSTSSDRPRPSGDERASAGERQALLAAGLHRSPDESLRP